jgi:hypothetical protein
MNCWVLTLLGAEADGRAAYQTVVTFDVRIF